ncbi:MAG: hypothetical protein JXJ04_22105 [Spirochaetales bacterium]|nr:hypothetical protein [Spirochaetales bacterium]
MIHLLPDDSTFDDIMEKLYLLYKIEKGIFQADSGKTYSTNEARQRLNKWLE